MKINLWIKVILLALSSNLSVRAEGHFFSCELSGKSSPQIVTYDTTKDVGKSAKYGDHDLLFLHEGETFKVMARGGALKGPKSKTIKLSEDKLSFDLSPPVKVKCQKIISEKRQAKIQLEKLESLSVLKEKVSLKILKDLKFRSVQDEENQLMRTLFFQNGNVYINSKDMERKLNWCSLRVQLKEKKDTLIRPGELFKPLSFQVQENSSYFTTYSYSFVDFAEGKKSGETETYAPFLFNCNLLRGMPYTFENFKSVVGDFLTIRVESASSQTPQR